MIVCNGETEQRFFSKRATGRVDFSLTEPYHRNEMTIQIEANDDRMPIILPTGRKGLSDSDFSCRGLDHPACHEIRLPRTD